METLKRGKIVLGNPEIQKLREGKSVVVRLKPGMEEIELKASILVNWPKVTSDPFAETFSEMADALNKIKRG